MTKLSSLVSDKKFQIRLFSGILLIVLAAVIFSAGGDVLFAAMLLVSLTGLKELYHVVGIDRASPGIAGYLCTIVLYGLLRTGMDSYLAAALVLSCILFLTVFVVTYPRYKTEQITLGYFGIIYVGLMFSYIWRIRMLPDGKILVWLILIASWGCDTSAYMVGMLTGRHHFAPVLSPKKTLEGSIGGIIGAALLGLLYGSVFASRVSFLKNPAADCLVVCAAGALISEIGDLAASAIKRDHGVKDYSTLIPGHGGILDRFDSVLFIAPVIWFVLKLLVRQGGGV